MKMMDTVLLRVPAKDRMRGNWTSLPEYSLWDVKQSAYKIVPDYRKGMMLKRVIRGHIKI